MQCEGGRCLQHSQTVDTPLLLLLLLLLMMTTVTLMMLMQ